MGADILFTRIAVTPDRLLLVSAHHGQRHPQQDSAEAAAVEMDASSLPWCGDRAGRRRAAHASQGVTPG